MAKAPSVIFIILSVSSLDSYQREDLRFRKGWLLQRLRGLYQSKASRVQVCLLWLRRARHATTSGHIFPLSVIVLKDLLGLFLGDSLLDFFGRQKLEEGFLLEGLHLPELVRVGLLRLSSVYRWWILLQRLLELPQVLLIHHLPQHLRVVAVCHVTN